MNQLQRSELAERIRKETNRSSPFFDALAVVDIVEQFYKEKGLVR